MHAYSAAGQIRANKKRNIELYMKMRKNTHTSRYRTCGQDNLYRGTRVQNRVFASPLRSDLQGRGDDLEGGGDQV